MLLVLRIKNFALIDELELELGAGLNVLTGETGAGKSIILDAIDLVLGAKASSRSLRGGTQQAILEATFQADSALMEWLKEQEIEPLEDDSAICTREISLVKGNLRSRSRVKGVLVNRQIIEQLRDRLVEITAQGQTGQLTLPLKQRELLDFYGGDSILQQRELVESAYENCQNALKALEKRRRSEQERLQRQDLLEYQIKDLKEVKLIDPEELEYLEKERARLAHVVELQQLSYQLYQVLYQNDNQEPAAADLLGQAESILTDAIEYDSKLESILELVRTAIASVVEAGHEVNAYGDSLEADPERLAEVEERIRTLKQICRKYGPSLAEAIAYYQKLQGELHELTDSGQSLEKLEQEYTSALLKLNRACERLTELRQQAARKLEGQLLEELKPLAMDKVLFECNLSPGPIGSAGADRVIFYFSPNPGEKLQPLSDTASGGEMSRFLLALKACFSNAERGNKTLIFDEIDAGVSGKVAQAIAEKLRQLGTRHQVLCVTHQPLVAAMADAHFRVEKHTIDDRAQIRTVVRIKNLEDRQTRTEELAQLTGGNSATDAIAFADSLLTKAAANRQGEQRTDRKAKGKSKKY